MAAAQSTYLGGKARFGIAVGNVQVQVRCQELDEPQACNGYPQTTKTPTQYVTLYNSAAIKYSGGTFGVGNQPAAIA
jgi:hypothetical protein